MRVCVFPFIVCLCMHFIVLNTILFYSILFYRRTLLFTVEYSSFWMYCVCAIIEQPNINHFVLYFMRLTPIKIEWLALLFSLGLNLDASHHKMELNSGTIKNEITFHFFCYLLCHFFCCYSSFFLSFQFVRLNSYFIAVRRMFYFRSSVLKQKNYTQTDRETDNPYMILIGVTVTVRLKY